MTKAAHAFEFLLFDGFSNIALSCAMEPLRDVKLRAGRPRANWIVTSLDGDKVTSSSGLQVIPERGFSADQAGSLLVLVAGYGVRRHASARLSSQLRVAVRHCEAIIAIDSAAWLLAEAGLLDGRQATIHWQELEEFAEAFPYVDTTRRHVVKSGKYFTCGGASTVLELMLDLLGNLFGPAAALNASSMFVYSGDRTGARDTAVPSLPAMASPLLKSAVELMAENIRTPLSKMAIAAELGVSERTLHRAFQSELQATPGRFAANLRLKQAEYLSKSTALPLEQIALRCGYASASSLCRAYKAAFGESLVKRLH